MIISSAQKFKLRKLIKELERYRGRHTELVSVYVPRGYDLTKIINHIDQEKGTATNIKSTSTRKNVISALERITQHLKLFAGTPEHGLAVFAGNVAEREGQEDVRVWSIEPPIPLKIRIYRCDKAFVLEYLQDMCDDKETYGLLVMDTRDASVALLRGKTIVPLLTTYSHVPGKIKAGGQSAHRFQMNRDLAVKAHYKKIAEYMKEQFLEMEGLKGIIVGGPGPTKYELVDSGFITGEVKKKIIAIKDLSYTGDFGIQELVDKSQDVLANEAIADEKKIVGKFLELLATIPGKVSYGMVEVKKNLEMGIVETVLVSESLDDETIEQLDEMAKKTNSEVKLISTETREGVQLKELGKVAAILRYEVA